MIVTRLLHSYYVSIWVPMSWTMTEKSTAKSTKSTGTRRQKLNAHCRFATQWYSSYLQQLWIYHVYYENVLIMYALWTLNPAVCRAHISYMSPVPSNRKQTIDPLSWGCKLCLNLLKHFNYEFLLSHMNRCTDPSLLLQRAMTLKSQLLRCLGRCQEVPEPSKVGLKPIWATN